MTTARTAPADPTTRLPLSDGMIRFARYCGVSVVNVVVTTALLVVGITVFGLSGGVANAVAVTLAALPAYVLYRRWVWEKRGENHLWKEVVPFWTYAVLGLVVSTAVVAWADRVWGGSLAPAVANLVAFCVLWVAKFFVLDRLLFGRVRPLTGG